MKAYVFVLARNRFRKENQTSILRVRLRTSKRNLSSLLYFTRNGINPSCSLRVHCHHEVKFRHSRTVSILLFHRSSKFPSACTVRGISLKKHQLCDLRLPFVFCRFFFA